MRRILFTSLALAFAALVQTKASATSILPGTYSLTNASAAGYALNGTIMLGSDGLVTGANLTFADPAVGTPTFSNVVSTGFGGYAPVADFAYISGSSGQVLLEYLTALDASGDIDLCVYGSTCNSYQASYVQIYTPSGFNGNGMANLSAGTLDPASKAGSGSAAVTPEPSSFLLLGTGVAALLFRMRKRDRSHAEAGCMQVQEV